MIGLTIGPVHTLAQDVVYALPIRRVLVTQQSGGTGVLGISNDGSTFANPTLANQAFETSAAFIKSTTSSAIVTLKAT